MFCYGHIVEKADVTGLSSDLNLAYISVIVGTVKFGRVFITIVTFLNEAIVQ